MLKNCVCLVLIVFCLTGKTFGNAFRNDFYIVKDLALQQSKNCEKTEIKQTIEYLGELKTVIDNLRSDLIGKHENSSSISATTTDHSHSPAIPLNCGEATACTKHSGYYGIKPYQYTGSPFVANCDADTEGGGWTIIQRRQDGSVDFQRTWADYKVGFGNIDGEFFIGLDKLYALTNFDGPQELLIIMEKNDLTTAYARYSMLLIGNETEKYILKDVGNYEGTAGDALKKRHTGRKFSTKDQDNDNWGDNCAQKFLGGWWYNDCHDSNLNGHYGDAAYGKGINWKTFTGYENSLKSVKMMIRRRRY